MIGLTNSAVLNHTFNKTEKNNKFVTESGDFRENHKTIVEIKITFDTKEFVAFFKKEVIIVEHTYSLADPNFGTRKKTIKGLIKKKKKDFEFMVF